MTKHFKQVEPSLKNRKACIVRGALLALFTLLPSLAQAQERPAEPYTLQPVDNLFGNYSVLIEPTPAPDPNRGLLSSFTVGAGTWLSSGQSERNYGGQGPIGFVDVLSDLRWRKMVSEALEVNVSALFCDRLILNADVGGGSIGGGRLDDQDFAISGRRGLFSDTLHPALNDNLRYFNVDLGWRFWQGPYFVFDGLIGYQYWREKYIAEGGTVVLDLLGLPNDPFPPGPVNTEQFTWQGLRVGVQSVLQVLPCCGLKTRVMLLPVTHLEMEDIHHLRTDLRQDPSVIDRATGGFGVLADFVLTYRICSGLSLEGGYRIWDVRSGTGETNIRGSNGTELNLPFNLGKTTREGLLLGLNYQF